MRSKAAQPRRAVQGRKIRGRKPRGESAGRAGAYRASAPVSPLPPRSLPPIGTPLDASFFDRDPQEVAASLLGLVLCRRLGQLWLMASLVEAEAYYLEDKASHASLGFTEKRRSLWADPGTIYMYYARGGDSFNMSARGAGNAVLFKAGLPLLQEHLAPGDGRRWPASDARAMLRRMHRLNPPGNPRIAVSAGRERPVERLCAGQTLLCRALGLRVPDWDGKCLPSPGLVLVDVGYRPSHIVCARRLGIPPHRDPHHLYRFVDMGRVGAATQNPLRSGAVGYETGGYEAAPLPGGDRTRASRGLGAGESGRG